MKYEDVNLPMLITFIVVHIFTAALIVNVDFRAEYLIWALLVYCVRWMGFTVAVHRYFSHKVCRTSRIFQFVLGIWGTLTMARSPIRFASGHRYHHRFSDSPKDLHSYHNHGFLGAYIGWVISKRYHENVLGHVGDLKRYPELVWLNRMYFIPNILLLTAFYEVGGLPLLTYAGFVSIVITWHVAFTVTILFHVVGRPAYETGDRSKNSFLLGLVTFGEGWHNNHHANMSSAKLGHYWWQFDFGYYLLLLMERTGLIWDLNKSTEPLYTGYKTEKGERLQVVRSGYSRDGANDAAAA